MARWTNTIEGVRHERFVDDTNTVEMQNLAEQGWTRDEGVVAAQEQPGNLFTGRPVNQFGPVEMQSRYPETGRAVPRMEAPQAAPGGMIEVTFVLLGRRCWARFSHMENAIRWVSELNQQHPQDENFSMTVFAPGMTTGAKG